MKLESVGILIGMRPFGERDMIAHIFTRDYGVMTGMLRGAQTAKKNRPLVGQYGAVSWNARLDSQLGTFHWEAEKNLIAPFMSDARALAFANSAFALIAALLPEREKYETLYECTMGLLENLLVSYLRSDNCPPPALCADSPQGGNSCKTWPLPPAGGVVDSYLSWEICLLAELGYAMDLTRCSGCGTVENLEYLSPKTARAVCTKCATPYIHRLYKLPVDLDATKKFIARICNEMNVQMPIARNLVMI